MKKLYNLIDLQLAEVKTMSEFGIRGHAFDIIKGSESDDLNYIIEDGLENFSLYQAIEVLNDWEYQVEPVK